MSLPRIPFARAIEDSNLLAGAWRDLHPEQRAVLKMIYGLPLAGAEIRLWHALNGGATWDDLGFVTSVSDTGLIPPTEEAEEATLIVGRRGTKTSVIGFALTYEALCGGHKAHLKNKRQPPKFLLIAQDLATAKQNLRQVILPYLETSPAAVAELGDPKVAITADMIRLGRCGEIVVAPPNIKVRGQAVPVCAMDEVGFWAKDKNAAAPDFEVEAAVRPAMKQFPHAKLFKTSTPWTKEGLLWQAKVAGTYGRHLTDSAKQRAYSRTLVFQAPTAVLNPTLSGRADARAVLARERDKDREAFRREFLAEFADAVSGFLPVDLLHRAVMPGLRRRAPEPGVRYIATMDPGFRRDAFAVCVGHLEADGTFVQDVVESWRGTAQAPLNPRLVLKTIAGLCKDYGVKSILSDQAHLESLQELARDEGLSVEPKILTSANKQAMWGEVLMLLNQQGDEGAPKVRILDHPDLLGELRALERILRASGAVHISGTRDDLAMVLAMAVQRALQYGIFAPKKEPVVEETTEAGCAAVRAAMMAEVFQPRTTHRAWWNR